MTSIKSLFDIAEEPQEVEQEHHVYGKHVKEAGKVVFKPTGVCLIDEPVEGENE